MFDNHFKALQSRLAELPSLKASSVLKYAGQYLAKDNPAKAIFPLPCVFVEIGDWEVDSTPGNWGKQSQQYGLATVRLHVVSEQLDSQVQRSQHDDLVYQAISVVHGFGARLSYVDPEAAEDRRLFNSLQVGRPEAPIELKRMIVTVVPFQGVVYGDIV